jgi:predicted DCC family thiol-disulfide oxidoreductase YuxK
MESKRQSPQAPRKDQYWLFWDGECGFCRRSIDWARARDVDNRLLPTPYQQAPDPPMDETLVKACARAVHLLHPDGRLERAGHACLTVLQLIGFPSTLIGLLRLPPLIWALELGYWLAARNRSLVSRLLFR